MVMKRKLVKIEGPRGFKVNKRVENENRCSPVIPQATLDPSCTFGHREFLNKHLHHWRKKKLDNNHECNRSTREDVHSYTCVETINYAKHPTNSRTSLTEIFKQQ